MAELNQTYKCEICGNVVKVLEAGAGELVCCGEAMKLLPQEAGTESAENMEPIPE